MQPDVIAFFHPQSNTFSYLVADPASGVAAVIDPAVDFDLHTGQIDTGPAQVLVDEVARRGWQVEWLLETHAHADHVSAAQWLKQQWPRARLGVGAGIVAVQRTFAPRYRMPEGFLPDGSQFDHLFEDEAIFALGHLPVRVLAVPGHTSDSVAYLIGESLFPGDSLFMPDGGTARCDFPGGDAGALFKSIRRLYELPDATVVYICHDYGPGGRAVAHATTIGEQRNSNVHVRGDTDEQSFVERRQTRDASLAQPRLIGPAIKANIQAGRFEDLLPL
ncbi:MAG TPA: MBL fold metallo-hydrolase [Stenotrophomonas sp.]|jgi:glyoxylase-like metal-dependent hydrolase (beta-lactamase superfamily II)